MNNNNPKEHLQEIFDLQNDTSGGSYVYSFKISRLLYSYSRSLIAILVSVGVFVFMDLDLTGSFLAIMFGAVALPGTILAINYTIYSKNKKLYFQKGNSKFAVVCGNNTLIYDKRKIIKKEKYHTSSRRCIWSDFKFYQLTMKDGSTLNISNLLMNENEFRKQFGSNLQSETTSFPFV